MCLPAGAQGGDLALCRLDEFVCTLHDRRHPVGHGLHVLLDRGRLRWRNSPRTDIVNRPVRFDMQRVVGGGAVKAPGRLADLVGSPGCFANDRCERLQVACLFPHRSNVSTQRLLGGGHGLAGTRQAVGLRLKLLARARQGLRVALVVLGLLGERRTLPLKKVRPPHRFATPPNSELNGLGTALIPLPSTGGKVGVSVSGRGTHGLSGSGSESGGC